MNSWIPVLFSLALSQAAAAEQTELPDTAAGTYRYTVGIGFSNFDTDTEDSDDPHLNEIGYSLLLGMDFNRYFGVDAEFLHVETAEGVDVFGTRTRFGAQGMGVSLRAQWPLATNFHIYLRGGAAWFELDDNSILRNQTLDEQHTQPIAGAGVRGEHWFVEYVNYGKVEDLHLEQVRAGVLIRF